jgi:Zn-dependent peptidase ImmA (M78 family)
MPRVNPAILQWARETAGLDLETAADKIDLRATRRASGPERLAALEAGEDEPSRPLLLRMVKHYHRPLLTFYLAQPPRKGDRGQDFRTLPEGSSREDEAVLDVLVRDLHARQAIVRAALEDEDERPDADWIGTARIDEGSEALVTRMREALAFRLSEFRAANDVETAFKMLRERVESLGVFVVLASNLGSHHTTLGVEVFRGLAIADKIAPFIVVNDQDSRAAWSFTVLHELAHLWLGVTGLSGGTFDRDVERFCNEVASELLLPRGDLAQLRLGARDRNADTERAITEFARARHLSRALVAYRLLREGRIDVERWRQITAAFRRQWLDQRERQRETAREVAGGPSYYVVRRHRIGQALLQTTARLLGSGALTTVKAGQVLGVRPNNVQALMAGLGPSGVAR